MKCALDKINDIRNSIIGYHAINWSAHIYPLVAALQEAGIEGDGWEKAREMAKTQIERIKYLEKERDELKAEVEAIKWYNAKVVNQKLRLPSMKSFDQYSAYTDKTPTIATTGTTMKTPQETIYTYFKIEFVNTSLDFDYTIVENISDIAEYLTLVETDLDDEENIASVVITGVGMTRAQYAEWFKDNVKP